MGTYNIDTNKVEPPDSSCEVTIGWTSHDGASQAAFPEHQPFHDAWIAGQPQYEFSFTLTDPPLNDYDSVNPRAVCEAVLEATNAPDAEPSDKTVVGRIVTAIRAVGYVGREAHYGLSVGDTIKVNGERYSRVRDGWTRDLTEYTEEQLRERRKEFAAHEVVVAPIDAELRRRENVAGRTRERQLRHLDELRRRVDRAEYAVDRVEELYTANPRLTAKQLLAILTEDRRHAAESEDVLRAEMGDTWVRDRPRPWDEQ